MSPWKWFGWMVIALMFGTALVAQASATSPVFVSVPPLVPIAQTGYYDIDGAVGGSVTVGRFTVRVARGAYTGVSRITINVPDPSVLRCTIGMNPPRTTFRTKPNLEANYSGASAAPKSFWWINYSPSTTKWAAASVTTLNTTLTKVIQPLAVFADHGVAASKTNW